MSSLLVIFVWGGVAFVGSESGQKQSVKTPEEYGLQYGPWAGGGLSGQVCRIRKPA